ncbi:MAG: hypothetical protein IJE43_00855 [Alphaproteobacteria bacterium]|nr:hypothetical protein [Alphaproteobacteria bacterium]
MSLGVDFKNLIDKLWNIERFNMWLPDEHGAIAYVLDRTYDTDKYSYIYDNLVKLAKDDTANDFAMYVCELTLELARSDSSYKPKDIEKMEQYYQVCRSKFDSGTLFTFSLVIDAYFPNWFFELFGSYIPLEKTKRELAIKSALEKEGYSKEQIELVYAKLIKQYDIIGELYYYVKTGKMKTFSPCTAKKISAKHLCETICKNPIEAYLFLVYLRECPEQALSEYKERISDVKS